MLRTRRGVEHILQRNIFARNWRAWRASIIARAVRLRRQKNIAQQRKNENRRGVKPIEKKKKNTVCGNHARRA